MLARLGISLTTGVIITFALLWLMQFLIATGRSAITERSDFRIADFIRVRPEETLETKDRKPDKPPEVEQPPPDIPPPQMDSLDPNAPAGYGCDIGTFSPDSATGAGSGDHIGVNGLGPWNHSRFETKFAV